MEDNAYSSDNEEPLSKEHFAILKRFVSWKLAKVGFVVDADQISIIQEGESLQIELIDELEVNIPDGLIDLENDTEWDEFSKDEIQQTTRLIAEQRKVQTQLMLEELKAGIPSFLQEQEQIQSYMFTHTKQVWQEAFDLLELLIGVATNAGAKFNQESGQIEGLSVVSEVLLSLHARGCQVAAEILTLLKAGFADGAHARWRSLHEINVIAHFIVDHGPIMTQRYLDHYLIDSYKAATQYNQYAEALAHDPFTEQEIEELSTLKNQMIDKYGIEFNKDYGWAASVIKNPNFSLIESKSQFDKWRPYYKMASHNVHAGVKGITYKLGLSGYEKPIRLTGPSARGMADPGQAAAVSLMQLTVRVLMLEPTPDRLVLADVLNRLSKEIQETFVKIHHSG